MTPATESTSDRPQTAEEAGGPDRHVCSVCGSAYPTERLLVLHRGARHPDDLTDAEVEAYREAYYEEESELKSFRVRALGILVALYFGFLILFVLFAS